MDFLRWHSHCECAHTELTRYIACAIEQGCTEFVTACLEHGFFFDCVFFLKPTYYTSPLYVDVYTNQKTVHAVRTHDIPNFGAYCAQNLPKVPALEFLLETNNQNLIELVMWHFDKQFVSDPKPLFDVWYPLVNQIKHHLLLVFRSSNIVSTALEYCLSDAVLVLCN